MPLSDSDILKLYCISTTGSPLSPGFYSSPQNDPQSSVGSQIIVSTSQISDDVDQNIFRLLNLDDIASGTYYCCVGLVNNTTGSPGAITLYQARIFFPNLPSQSGVQVDASVQGTAGQGAVTGPATETTAPAGVQFYDCANHTTWATGLKAGTGSPAADRSLLPAKANAIYIIFRITLTNVDTALLKSNGNNQLQFKLAGGEA